MGFSQLGKTFHLPRTQLEYSVSHPLTEQLAKYPISEELLQDLRDINDEHLLQVAYLKRVAKQAPQALADCYLYFLQQTGGTIPTVYNDNGIRALLAAKARFNQQLIANQSELWFSKQISHLYLFGYYQHLHIDDEPLQNIAQFNQWIKVLSQCNKYNCIPNMLAKKERFLPFADTPSARRAYHTISLLNGDDEFICLTYWGLVFIALLNEEVKPLMQLHIASLVGERHAKTQQIFARYLQAAA